MEIKNEEKTLNDVFAELDVVMKQLNEEQISLEDSFNLYHQGMELLKVCNDKIDTVEKKMLVLDENGEAYEF
ncbi:MAG: exodeoxyribonuclease VII small subunit [Lachnospiraceae bacterium]